GQPVAVQADRPDRVHGAAALRAGRGEDERPAVGRNGHGADGVARTGQLADATADAIEVNLHVHFLRRPGAGGGVAGALAALAGGPAAAPRGVATLFALGDRGLLLVVDALVGRVLLFPGQGNDLDLRGRTPA